MKLHLALAAIALAPLLHAAPDIYPLKDVRAGQHGVGRTVFAGNRIEEFQVEVLGVLENIGPKQSIILARLSGGPLAETGVLQGMSGSPVYIDGKLVGAVALGFSEAKVAIAGIRPIEEMLSVQPQSPVKLASVRPRASFVSGGMKLEEIATPLAFSGFTAATLDHFAPQLRALGLDPQQGVSGGANPPDALGDPKTLDPGSMISVHLMSGDMNVNADGTVTTVDGDKIYAFGHRFMATGPTDLPFARAEVLALLPNLANSFKISQSTEWMGSITADRDTAISGIVGRRAETTPFEIHVGKNDYHMNLARDPILTPMVAQMAVFSAIDSTQRSVGAATYAVRGHADFEGGGTVKLDNVYSGDVNTATMASLGVATPLSYALTSGFDALRLKSVTLDIIATDRHNQMQIADAFAPHQVHPGEDVEISVVLVGEDGVEMVKKTHYRVPVGAPAGLLYLTVSDASSANLFEFQGALGVQARSAEQVLNLLNGLRPNTSAYVRVWRADAAYNLDGRDLPDPPASLAAILGRSQPGAAALVSTRGAKVAEIEVPAGENLVTGSKTIQIEVKE
ncbi:MAG TPA: SpoIVB peptidase S55 domain-containing protein [Bryobacteraceae bacterium]